MSKIIKSYEFTVKGRPRVKERPRLTMGNLQELGASIFSLFQRNKAISYSDFWSQFYKLMRMFARVYTPTNTQEYEELVGYTALSVIKQKNNDDLMIVEINLYFADKKVGDVDNYTKSILDGLHAIMDDDKQVKKIITEKFIKEEDDGKFITKDNERAEITIHILDQKIYYKKNDGIIKKSKKQDQKVMQAKPSNDFFIKGDKSILQKLVQKKGRK